MNWFLLPLSPHPHVILHEGFTRSCRIHCFKKRSKTFSLEGEDARRADEGGGVRGTSEILPDHFQNLFSSLKHVMIPEP